MARHRSLSTATTTAEGTLVPWLAASGPLAYTPESPPTDDYYFQYSWVLPGIFGPKTNRRRRFYFGVPNRENAREIFAFWEAARAGDIQRIASRVGSIGHSSVTAPILIYATRDRVWGPRYLLMQHGSYQLVPQEDQPLLGDGDVVLYRGIGGAKSFHFIENEAVQRLDGRLQTWQAYLRVQAHVLSDSVMSFNSIHDRAKRCETCHLQDDTWVTDALARGNHLDIETDRYAKALWDTTHQSFSLVRWVAENKFGPSYIRCKTPIDNIRITTFFAGEHEARIIDPDRVEFLDAVGCQLERLVP